MSAAWKHTARRPHRKGFTPEVVSHLQRGVQTVPPSDLGFSAGTMDPRISPQDADRARRFGLRFPVYFRELGSPTWLKGTTENISYTGMLLLSSLSLGLESTLQLRLQLNVGEPAEIRCKGAVVRVEQRSMQEAPIALAVAISNYRIVRRHSLTENPEWIT